MKFHLKPIVLLAAMACTSSLADTRMDEPYGSRYLNYTQNAVWSSHYGIYSDGGWPVSLYPKFIEDVNGDGMADAVAFGKPGTYVSLSNGTSFVGITEAIAQFGTDQGWTVAKHPRFVEDLNGDGKKDLVGYGDAGVYAAIYSGTGTTPAFNQLKLWSNQFGALQNNGFYLNANFIRTLADMNNDQKSDLVVFADTGIQVALSNGNGFDAPTQWVDNFGTDWAWNNTDYVRQIADVNGDGKLDVLGYGLDAVYVSINNGNNTLSTPTSWTSQYSNQDRNGFYRNANFIRTSGDANGDGKTDLIVFADDGVYVAISTGSAFSAGVKWIAAYGTATSDGAWDNTKYLRQIADVNGDSMADIVGFHETGTFFSMSEGSGFSASQQWVTDFGYNIQWRDTTTPRYLRDVNGDGALDITGYGNYGVYVSPSAPLWCCDHTYYPDGSLFVVDGYMARIHIPTAMPNIVMPERDPTICPATQQYRNNYRAIGPNAPQPSAPWLGTSWRTTLGARFAFNANFFDISHGPTTYQCTNGLGISVSNGHELSDYNNRYVMVLYNQQTAASKGMAAEIVPGSSIQNTWQDIAEFAFAGNLLIKDGVAQPSQPDPTSRRARAAAGLTKDGNTMVIVIQNDGIDRGGTPVNNTVKNATLAGMANALLRLGAYNAVNLDGSGSAQFWFKNNKSEFYSEPSDGSGLYRGVPIAIGVK